MARDRLDIRISERGGRRVARNIKAIGRSSKKAASSVALLKKSLLPIAAVAGVGFGLVASVRVLADFSQAMSTVQAITQSTGDEFEALTSKARELGATTRFSATEAAEGMIFLARAGFEVNEVFSTIGPTLLLAQSGALGLARAADISSNILKGFRLEAEEMSRVVDVLALTANSSNTSVEQLGDAMKFVAPIAAGLGVSLETTAAAIGVLGDAGIQGTLAGTALRTVMLELTAPTDRARDALRLLGLEVMDVNTATNDFVTVLQRLKAQGAGIQEIAQLVSRRGVAPLSILVESADEIGKFQEALEEAEGTAKRVADIMDDNLNGALLRTKSAFQELVLATGSLGPESLLNQFFDALAFSLREISKDLPEILIDVISFFEKFTNVMIGLKDQAKIVFTTIGDLIVEGISNGINSAITNAEALLNFLPRFLVEIARGLDVFNVFGDKFFDDMQKELDANPFDFSEFLIRGIKETSLEEFNAAMDGAMAGALTNTPKADKALADLLASRKRLKEAQDELLAAESEKGDRLQKLEESARQAKANFLIVQSLDRLKSSLDPAYAAELRLAEGQRILNNALREGIIEGDEFDRLMQKLSDSFRTVAEEAEIAALRASRSIRGNLRASLIELKADIDNVGDEIAGTMVNAFQSAEDSLVDFIRTAKLDFRSLADSIISDLARIAVRQAILGPLVGALGNFFSPGAALPLGATGQQTAPFGAFASGGLITRPTLALAGEAGPEAVLPLSRLSNGDLGVQTTGGGGGGINIASGAINIVVQASGSGGQAVDDQDAARVGKAVETSIRNIARQEVRRARRPGGVSNQQDIF